MRRRISIRGCVRPSDRPSVRPSVTHELKPCKSAVFDQNYFQYQRERILWPCIRPCFLVISAIQVLWETSYVWRLYTWRRETSFYEIHIHVIWQKAKIFDKYSLVIVQWQRVRERTEKRYLKGERTEENDHWPRITLTKKRTREMMKKREITLWPSPQSFVPQFSK